MPGVDGTARCPACGLWVDDGELCLDPLTDPTFFLGYLGEEVTRGAGRALEVEDRRDGGTWRTGDRVARGRATATCTSTAAPTT